MKIIFFIFAVFCSLKINAQNLLITFNGSGASAAVSTLKVGNLTKATSLNLNGSDILRLTLPTGISQYDNAWRKGLSYGGCDLFAVNPYPKRIGFSVRCFKD